MSVTDGLCPHCHGWHGPEDFCQPERRKRMPDNPSDLPFIHAVVEQAFILPGYDHLHTRSGSAHSGRWDWVAEEPIIIRPGYRVIAEVSKDGDFSVRREKL
jgi:hypothetical protein